MVGGSVSGSVRSWRSCEEVGTREMGPCVTVRGSLGCWGLEKGDGARWGGIVSLMEGGGPVEGGGDSGKG